MQIRENHCRICLKEDTNPGNDISKAFFWDLTAAEAIQQLFGIKINLSEKNLPRKLCTNCRGDLEIAVGLRTVALQSYGVIEQWRDSPLPTLPQIEVKLESLFEYKDDIFGCNSIESSVKEEPQSENDYKHEEIDREIIENYGPPETYNGYLPETYATEPYFDDDNTKTPTMYCNECGKAFTRRTSLIRHVRTHVENRPYMCTHCSKTFQRPYCLKRHLRTHTGERPYACDRCDRSFADRSNLMAHIRIHTEGRGLRRQMKLKTKQVFVCVTCNLKYRKRLAYKKHMMRVHGEQDISTLR